MARRIAPGRNTASPTHLALADWHEDRAAHYATFPALAERHQVEADLCRTGVPLVVGAVELCGALHLAGDPAWRNYQHRTGEATADPAAYWEVDERGRVTGPFAA